ncbi:DUF4145 domain-containing protein [Pseudomonas helleri]|nr:DUF4145 domain-containing protein [Pseudomonas helleri]
MAISSQAPPSVTGGGNLISVGVLRVTGMELKLGEFAVNEVFFVKEFTKTEIPNYPCPSCGAAELVNKSFVCEENSTTKLNKGDEDWEPEYDEHVFNLTLECRKCFENIFISGDAYTDEEMEVESDTNWSRYYIIKFRPKYIFPSLKFISCPKATPKEVKENVGAAAALYYAHPTACSNTLRIAAEDILTSLGVSEAEPGKYISFGNRIKELPEESMERTLLEAIRWLGNDGSHSKSLITHADAQDAFEVMNLLIEEVYSDRKKKIQELAKVINQSRGPVRLRGYRD